MWAIQYLLFVLLLVIESAGCMNYAPATGASQGTVVPNRVSNLPDFSSSASSRPEPSAELCQLLDETLQRVLRERRLNAVDHAAWQVMHGVLAFGRAFPLEVGGRRISALDYLLDGGALQGWQWEPGDVLDAQTGLRGWRAVLAVGSRTGQGHADQWLGYLATCGLPANQRVRYGSDEFTIEQVVRQVERDVSRNETGEFSWTLMGLSAYRPSHHRWIAADGQLWSFEKLLELELRRDRDRSPCGGTHRLYGVALALNRHLAQGGSLEGVWADADRQIQEAIALARAYQNTDGSFSSYYFARSGTSMDLSTCLATTGHVFEFLALAVDRQQLQAGWVERAARYLCGVLERTSRWPLDCGVLYHAVHGLVLYRHRLCGAPWFTLPESSWEDTP